jgi:predicted lipoprotein with Yx(FWY)xxD motif
MSKRFLGMAMAFALVLAACGSSGGSSKSADTSSSSSSSSTSSPLPFTDGTSTTLQLVPTSLGKVVADSKGKVLYLYVPDGTATVSKVPVAALAAWPPVQADAVPTLGPGLTAKAAANAQPNGQQWVSYNGHLLYGFTGDQKAGDVNGNGSGNIWYAVTAAGGPVQS